MQAYCDADRLDLAEDLVLQWLLLSGGNSSNSGGGSSSGNSSSVAGSSGSGSTTLTTIATRGNATSSEEVALDAIVEYLTSYRKIMTSTTTSGLNPASSNTENSEGVVSINNIDSSNNSLYSGSIDLSSLLSPSLNNGTNSNNSNSNSLAAIPPPVWLSLLRLYADRGDQ